MLSPFRGCNYVSWHHRNHSLRWALLFSTVTTCTSLSSVSKQIKIMHTLKKKKSTGESTEIYISNYMSKLNITHKYIWDDEGLERTSRKPTLHIGESITAVRMHCPNITCRLIYIPDILTSYPSANRNETQHVAGKTHLNHTELGWHFYKQNYKDVVVDWNKKQQTKKRFLTAQRNFNHHLKSHARCCKPWRKRQGGKGRGDDLVSQSQSPGNWMYAARMLWRTTQGEIRTEKKQLIFHEHIDTTLPLWVCWKAPCREKLSAL